MNLFADESVDRQIVERLRRDGFQVPFIAEMAPGISDDAVLDRANQEGAMLITADKDFGELVFRQNRISHGVILLRLAGISAERKAEIVASAIQRFAKDLPETFAIIMPNAVRIRRKLP